MSQAREGDWRWRLRTAREIKVAAMKRWLMKLGGVGALVAVLALGTVTMGAQPEADAPFLYYYSAERGAFIVERADGSESRVLAEYALPDTHDFITGPGWSPSGDWFAWTSVAWMSGSDENSHIWVVNRRGDEVVANPPNDGTIIDMEWATSGNLLLVHYDFLDQARQANDDAFNIFDVETRQIFESDELIDDLRLFPRGLVLDHISF